MDDVNRVKNIKEKFEGTSHLDTQFKLAENIASEIIPVESVKTVIHNDKNVNHRSNIKRTPAFRKDKTQVRNIEKNDFISKSADSLVTSRVHLFNKLDDIKDSANVKPENDDVKENKPFKITTTMDIDKLKQTNITELKQFITNKKPIASRQNSIEELYTKVKKSPTRVIKSPKKSNEFSPPHQNSASIPKQRSVPSMSACNRSKIYDELSDTLKRVLRSPLPPGPPPKKPPRTFISTATGLSDMNKSKACDNKPCGNYGKINTTDERGENKIPRLLRSKTESEIMLQKIESALLKHQVNTLAFKEGNNKLDLNEKSIDKGQDMIKRHNSNISCFGSTHCASSSESDNVYAKSTCYQSSNCVPISTRRNVDHIYEDPDILNTSANQGIPDSNLHYMSTPIDSIINSSEMIRANEVESGDIKSAKNIAGIYDTPQNVDSKKPTNVLGDPTIEKKIKIWVNEAYGSSLQRSGTGDSELGISTDEADGLTRECYPTEQCDQVTLLRKGYVQKVASKLVSRQQSILAQFSDYKHLFECLLLIGLNLDNANNKVPYIKMKYPANTNVPQCIEHLCFPDAHEWSNDTEIEINDDDENNRYYTITITTEDGRRKYVYCRRLKPEGESALLPLSYCVLSPHKANEFYFKILEEVEARHGKTEVEFFNFIRELYETRYPCKGESVAVPSCVEEQIEENKDIRRSSDPRLEDLNLAKTLQYLKINVFLLIFSSMLLERKVILLSSSISKLSSCIEGLQTALLPFQWQHTLITVVPSSVISINDLCEAPTPYLIGVLKSSDNSQVLPALSDIKQEVVAVDIDDQKVMKKVGDEQSILPKHLTIGLKNALQLAHSSEIRTNNLLACEAFTRLFVELLCQYKRYIIRSNVDRRMNIQKEAFLRATTTHSIRMFLEWFVETAAFSAFIEAHSSSTDSRILFEKRLIEYVDELNKQKYAKNSKVRKTVEKIGDFFKDLTIVS